MVEAPAKEWSFNDAPVPWILPTSYRNPNETVPDFPDDDNEAEGPPGKESGLAPLTGASTEVVAVGGAEEDDDGFETVDDREGEPGNKVVVSIPAKEVAKPEGSILTGNPMFESEVEDDPEIKKQIEAALNETGLLGELMLSDKSESETSMTTTTTMMIWTRPSGITRIRRTRRRGLGSPGLKPSSPKAVNIGPAAVPEDTGNPICSGLDAPSGNAPLTKPGATKGKGSQQ